MRAELYRADPPALRRTVALDGGLTAIFHRPSATTHLVSAPVPEILEALARGPASAADVLRRLAEEFELAVAPENGPAELAARLEELVTAGLVMRE